MIPFVPALSTNSFSRLHKSRLSPEFVAGRLQEASLLILLDASLLTI